MQLKAKETESSAAPSYGSGRTLHSSFFTHDKNIASKVPSSPGSSGKASATNLIHAEQFMAKQKVTMKQYNYSGVTLGRAMSPKSGLLGIPRTGLLTG